MDDHRVQQKKKICLNIQVSLCKNNRQSSFYNQINYLSLHIMNFHNPCHENMKFCAHSGKAISPFKENKNHSLHTLIEILFH